MKYQFVTILLISVLLSSCGSVKQHNKNVYALRTEKELQKDVDYLHKKLQKRHPNLYWYISKQTLDYKFDSLKHTITSPMTGNEFYRQISPLLASIRQGHDNMSPLVEKISPKVIKTYQKKGKNPLTQFEYALFDDKLYIVKNNSADTSVQKGSEVVAINGITPQEIYRNFRLTVASDGYNETFYPKAFARHFDRYYQSYNGKPLLDSAFYQLRYNDATEAYWVCRTPNDTSDISKYEKKRTEKVASDISKHEKKRAEKAALKTKLTYLEADSSIALMIIPQFLSTSYSSFYRKKFKQLREANTHTLIIDLRNNTGGAIRNVQKLYAYLIDTTFYLTSKVEVASRTSLLQPNCFKNNSIIKNIFNVLSYHGNLINMGITLLKTKKDDETFYYYQRSAQRASHKPLYFNGDMYVLMNGLSFSASSMLSSNLHGAKRAVFVGEETGGAYNGCVAGQYYRFVLPKSKLTGRFGLMAIHHFYQTEIDGRGIMPDIEVGPTLEDRINGNDPELNTVLELVRSKEKQN